MKKEYLRLQKTHPLHTQINRKITKRNNQAQN